MLKERGQFKATIKNALFSSPDVLTALLGKDANTIPMTNKREMFHARVKTHLFIDTTLTDRNAYIFFDTVIPDVSVQTKECKIILYSICHRELLDEFSMEGYSGNRADILSETIEEALLDEKKAKEFGIGDLLLDSVEIYNAKDYYGCVMIFSAECFR